MTEHLELALTRLESAASKPVTAQPRRAILDGLAPRIVEDAAPAAEEFSADVVPLLRELG